MIKRVLLSVAMLCALGAAVATAVVALAFAVFALLESSLGRAGAGGVVALIFAVFAGIVALLIEVQIKGRRRPAPKEASLTDRLAELARDRPLLAAGGALAAGLIALKNPQVVATVVSAVLGAKAADKAGRNRR